jgi:hypothetical protein
MKLAAADTAADAVEQAKAAKRKSNAASKFRELLQQSHKIQSKGATKPAAALPAAKLAPSGPDAPGSRFILSQKRYRHNPDAVWPRYQHAILYCLAQLFASLWSSQAQGIVTTVHLNLATQASPSAKDSISIMHLTHRQDVFCGIRGT